MRIAGGSTELPQAQAGPDHVASGRGTHRTRPQSAYSTRPSHAAGGASAHQRALRRALQACVPGEFCSVLIIRAGRHVIRTVHDVIRVIRHMIHTVRHMILTLHHMARTVRHMIRTVRYIISTVQYMLLTVQYIIHTVQYMMRTVRDRICNVRNVVRTVRHMIHSIRHAVEHRMPLATYYTSLARPSCVYCIPTTRYVQDARCCVLYARRIAFNDELK